MSYLYKLIGKSSIIIHPLTFFIYLFCVFNSQATHANPLSGDYFGTATIQSPAGLGNVDLAFHLELGEDGRVGSGSHVIIAKTALFPVVATVEGEEVGPGVSGTVTLEHGLDLVIDDFDTTLFAGTASERRVTHHIVLDNSLFDAEGKSVTGTYTETLTGYLSQPVTVNGNFVLISPAADSGPAPGCGDSDGSGSLDIDEIRAGGSNPKAVEFVDISCAVYHYRNHSSGLSVSDAVIGQAIQEYKDYLETR